MLDVLHFSSFSIFRKTGKIESSFNQCVSIFFLPAGNSSKIDTSISPNAVIASVLGIGVAVMKRTSGFKPLSLKIRRCSTPKRCCSSVMTNPGLLKITSGWISACVPINKSISPNSSCSSKTFLAFSLC